MTPVTLTRSIPTLRGDLPAGLMLFVISWGLEGAANLADRQGRLVVSQARAESFHITHPLTKCEHDDIPTDSATREAELLHGGTAAGPDQQGDKNTAADSSADGPGETLRSGSPGAAGAAAAPGESLEAGERAADPDRPVQADRIDTGEAAAGAGAAATEGLIDECPFDPNIELASLRSEAPSLSARQVTGHASRFTSEPSLTPNLSETIEFEDGSYRVVIAGGLRPRVCFVQPERYYHPEDLKAYNADWLREARLRIANGLGHPQANSEEESLTAKSESIYPDPGDWMNPLERQGWRYVDGVARFGPDRLEDLPQWQAWLARVRAFAAE